MSLWLCLRFAQLPLQCLSHTEDQPVIVLAGQRVVCANDCAATLGIQADMTSATVRALAGTDPVQLLERDETAEQRRARVEAITRAVRNGTYDTEARAKLGAERLFRALTKRD